MPAHRRVLTDDDAHSLLFRRSILHESTSSLIYVTRSSRSKLQHHGVTFAPITPALLAPFIFRPWLTTTTGSYSKIYGCHTHKAVSLSKTAGFEIRFRCKHVGCLVPLWLMSGGFHKTSRYIQFFILTKANADVVSRVTFDNWTDDVHNSAAGVWPSSFDWTIVQKMSNVTQGNGELKLTGDTGSK